VGISNSRGEIIAFIDDDCAVFSDWLQVKQFQFDTGLKYSHYANETDLIG
jgi:hypothetical protein